MVGIHVASFNTKELTRRCVDSILERTRGAYELTVGDSASADGSLELLQSYERSGRIRLQVESEQRPHSWWLDRWTRESPHEFAVFVDSDVVVRGAGWLGRLVQTAERTGAAIVAGELCREWRDFVEPVGGVTVRLAERPAPWMLLVRPDRIRELDRSFAWTKRETDAVPEGVIAYDIGAWLFEAAKERGLRWQTMSPWYRRRSYAHLHGGSWRR